MAKQKRLGKRNKLTIGSIVAAGLVLFFAWVAQGPARPYLEAVGLDISSLTGSDSYSKPSSYQGDGSEFLFGGMPKSERKLLLLDNPGFLIGYDEGHHSPAWVAFRMSGPVVYHDHERIGGFEVDERTKSQISHGDYTRSGYSRGHMAPSYGIYSRYGKDAQRATYLMTNICPQLQDLNGGRWASLERKIAGTPNGDGGWAERFKEIWVMAGPVYDSHERELKSGVEVPDAFFKIVLDRDETSGGLRVLAFLSRNVKGKGRLEDDLTSVDNIEKLTGLDFFPELEDDVEDEIESRTARFLWPD